MSGNAIEYFAIGTALLAIIFGIISAKWILGLPDGDAKMKSIASAIQEGASAYMKRQYKLIAIVGVIVFFILLFSLGKTTAIGFLIGAVLSGLTGFIGMFISVRANVRTAQAARTSMEKL